MMEIEIMKTVNIAPTVFAMAALLNGKALGDIPQTRKKPGHTSKMKPCTTRKLTAMGSNKTLMMYKDTGLLVLAMH